MGRFIKGYKKGSRSNAGVIIPQRIGSRISHFRIIIKKTGFHSQHLRGIINGGNLCFTSNIRGNGNDKMSHTVGKYAFNYIIAQENSADIRVSPS